MVFRCVLRRVLKCDLRTPVLRIPLMLNTSKRKQSSASLVLPRVDIGAYFKAPFHKDTCEDACFYCDLKEIVAFGVADGVSGWRYRGVDAAVFPNTLVVNCINHFRECNGKIKPQELIDKAYKDVLDDNQVEAGSSTICIGILDKRSGMLRTANLGDSGYVIFRNGKAIFKSKDQHVHPNVPYQIGVKEIKDGKSIPHGNKPADATVAEFYIHPNDIVLAATDGLFENLFLPEILEIILSNNQNSPDGSINWNTATKELVITAQKRSVELKRITPRERRIQKIDEYSLEMPGGNFDDVAVVGLQGKNE